MTCLQCSPRFPAPLPGNCRPTKRVQRGFSLLEALVAMAIAAMALGSLYRSVGQSSKNAADLGVRVEAALVARSVLAAATFAEDLNTQLSGQSGRWYWVLRVQPDQALLSGADGRTPGPALRVARVVVDVMPEKDGATVMTWTAWKPYRSAP